MNKILVSLFALGLFGATANAATNGYTLSKTPQTTARQAALGAAAYTFNRAYKGNLYSKSNLSITKVIDSRGKTQKFQVSSDNGIRTRVVTVKQLGSRAWAGFIPNTKSAVSNSTNRK